MDRRDRGRDRDQPRPRLLRVPDARRAKGDGADAAPLRPQPRGPVRSLAADCRPRQADPQGELLPGRGDRRPLHLRTVPRRFHRTLHVLGDSVGARLDDRRVPGQRLRGRPPDRPPPDLRDRLAGDLRVHPRRLVVRFQVRAARVDAHVRAARLVRGGARAERARRHPDGALALARRHRAGPGRRDLVRPAAVRRFPRVPDGRHGRDGAGALRPSRGGAGARRGLPHRIRRHALRALLDVRVHQPDHALGPLRDTLPRRLARALGTRARSGSWRSCSCCCSSSSGSARRSPGCGTTS